MKSHAYLLAICRNLLSTAVPEGVTPELVRCEEDTAQPLLDRGRDLAARIAASTPTASSSSANPMVHIPEVAKRIGADLIVVGHRYRSRFAQWWSEDEESTLLHKVSCSILVGDGAAGVVNASAAFGEIAHDAGRWPAG